MDAFFPKSKVFAEIDWSALKPSEASPDGAFVSLLLRSGQTRQGQGAVEKHRASCSISHSRVRDREKWGSWKEWKREGLIASHWSPCLLGRSIFFLKANSKIWVSGETWGTAGSLRILTRTTKPWSRTFCQLGTPAQKTLEGMILCNCYSADLSK